LLLDIRDISILADYVIGSTTSDRQAKAILDEVREKVKQETNTRLRTTLPGCCLKNYDQASTKPLSAKSRKPRIAS